MERKAMESKAHKGKGKPMERKAMESSKAHKER